MTKQNITVAIIIVVLCIGITALLYYGLGAQRSRLRSLVTRIPSSDDTNGSNPGHGRIFRIDDDRQGQVRERPELAHLARGNR